MEGHSEANTRHHAVRLDNLSWRVLNSNCAAVKMRDGEVNTGECLLQADFSLHYKVSTLPLELLELFDLDNDDNISCLDIGDLVALAVNGVLASVGGALIHLDGQLLSFLLDFLALADIASQFHVNNLALAAAVVTGASALGVHAWTHLTQDRSDTLALAGSTSLDGTLVLTADTVTGTANTLPLDIQLNCLAVVNVSESHLNLTRNWLNSHFAFRPSSAGTAAASEHLRKYVARVTSSACALVKSFFSVFIIDLTLILIEENVIGLLDLFEFSFITTLVRMVFDREFAVRLTNVIRLSF